MKIKQSIPDDIQQQFNELIEKQRSMTLSDAEHARLIELTYKIKDLDAKRIEYLAQLAQLKQQSLSEVMQELRESKFLTE